MPEKICSLCGVTKPLAEFFADKRKPDGKQSRCKQCDTAKYAHTRAGSQRAWRERNPDKAKETRTYESRREYFEAQRAAPGYKDWKREKDAEYRASAKGRARVIRNRAKRRYPNGVHEFTKLDWEATTRVFGRVCAYCGGSEEVHHDHFIPLAQGGQTVRGNIVPCCLTCNSLKGDTPPDEWCAPDVFDRIYAALVKL
ncbi:HNH endonuclease [Deinococcus phoenicis]|uniref:HNH endonuclease n=1 Tax=Deinococcus phoenicis TaxID=1476583 RepID=UPI000551094E|nr:HNH endonuclease signature motif containing protein [Deinococcus phoenicis]